MPKCELIVIAKEQPLPKQILLEDIPKRNYCKKNEVQTEYISIKK